MPAPVALRTERAAVRRHQELSGPRGGLDGAPPIAELPTVNEANYRRGLRGSASPMPREFPAERRLRTAMGRRDGLALWRSCYCVVDFGVATIRVTTIALRSRQAGTRGAILVFQWSLS
jgi:hypothetical protein